MFPTEPVYITCSANEKLLILYGMNELSPELNSANPNHHYEVQPNVKYNYIVIMFASGRHYSPQEITYYVKLLAPGGLLYAFQDKENDHRQLVEELMTHGCSNVVSLCPSLLVIDGKDINFDVSSAYCVRGKKSVYEFGSSVPVNVEMGKIDEKLAKVWKLSLDNDDDDIIDSNDLLQEEDLKKPNPDSLKVCGTTGKRKACKDCTCGLADELINESNGGAKVEDANKKPSCGSVI